MVVPLDKLLDVTEPIWLEAALVLIAAVFLACAKYLYFPDPRGKGKKFGDGADTLIGHASLVLSQTIDNEVTAGRNEAALAAWRASNFHCVVLLDCLPNLVRAFLDVDPDAFIGEMLEYMGAHAASLATPKAAAVVLDAVGRAGHVQLLEELAMALHQRLDIPAGTATYEALLNGFAAAGCKQKVLELVDQMHARQQKVTLRGFSVIIKGFLRSGLIDEALEQLGNMRAQGFHVPAFAVAELFRAAREAGRCAEIFEKVIDKVKLSTEAVTILLDYCLSCHDRVLAERVKALAASAGLPLAPTALEALLRLYASAGDVKALELIDEMQRSGNLRLTEGFCVGLLTRCAEAKFLRLAEDVVRRARAQQGKMSVTLYSALMKVCAFCGLYSKACELYDQLCADGLQPDSIMYGCVLRFANECGRTDLIHKLSDKVDAGDLHHCMSLMRAAGSEGDLARAFEHFEKLKAGGGKPDVVCYNCLVDVCITAGDMRRARALLDDMRASGHVDKISYNTMMKGYCVRGDFEGAKLLLKEMEAAGFPPNDITFNSLINMAGAAGKMSDAWGFLNDMRKRGIALDKYTICTMLKSLRRSGGSRQETICVLEYLDKLDLNICSDEVLLNIVLDTCIRNAEHHRLESILATYEKSNLWPAVHTYGSLIRAYSALRLIDRCRQLWAQMIEERGMQINNIVFGCMLDAFVCSGCMQEALDLFEKYKGHVSGNSVIYSTLMKGFANSHNPDQAMRLFHEMRASGIRPTSTCYNTVADALARVGNSNAVQKLVELMTEDRCEPDHVTQSIRVKAYCIAGELDQALVIFKAMQLPGKGSPCRPGVGARDGSVTIAFNTLLDGCTKHNKMTMADHLLDHVEDFGVQPTNFTLCILLKMCGRRRQIARALRAAESWPKRYNFKSNSAVNTCLLSACLKCESLESAFKVFQDVKAAGFADAKSYGMLIVGCIRHGALEQAVRLVEEAFGLDRHDGVQPAATLDVQVIEQLVNALAQQGFGAAIGQPMLCRLQAVGAPVSGRLWALAV